MTTERRYSIDTSSFLEAWVRRYPIDIFPSLWDGLEKLIESGRLVMSAEVLKELKPKDDGAHDWARTKSGLVVPVDPIQDRHVAAVLSKTPKLVNTIKGRSKADPFVIALAVAKSATVVCQEDEGTDEKPRIPYACSHFKVPCISFLDLIRDQEWKY